MPSSTGTTISLCMIVRNEERHLAECLSPVASLFDEIVIVDTGSTDKTKEIAAGFTDRIFQFSWCDDFSAARNESLRHARGDWVFWLDADDRILPAEVEKLSLLFKSLGRQKHAYLITTVCRSQYDCDGVQYLGHIRLFFRDPAIQWKGRVHEQLSPAPSELGYEVALSDIQIEHLGYSEGSQQLKKAQRDIRLLRMDFAMNPDDTSTLFHLALAYARTSNLPEAKKFLQLLESQTQAGQDWQVRLYVTLADLAKKSGEFHQALEYADRGLAVFPNDIALLYSKAETLYDLDQTDACVEICQRILVLPNTPGCYAGTLGQIKEKWAPLLLANTWLIQGRQGAAIELLNQALENFPNDLRLLYSLGLNNLLSGQSAKLPEIRARMETVRHGRVFSLLLSIDESFQTGNLGGVDEVLEELTQLAPQMARPRILRVEYLERINAPVATYLDACRDVLRFCPNHSEVIQKVAQIESALAERATV